MSLKSAQACQQMCLLTASNHALLTDWFLCSFLKMFPFVLVSLFFMELTKSKRSAGLFFYTKTKHHTKLDVFDNDVYCMFVGMKQCLLRNCFSVSCGCVFLLGLQIQIILNKFRKNKYLQGTNHLCFTEHHIWIENILSILKNAFFIIQECHAWFGKPCLLNQGTWVTCTSSDK